jgi:DNA-dependent RNA polymerase auxiliary subunit epsilon
MCRYSYSNGKCANMDIDLNFCVGERNCNLTDILRNRVQQESFDTAFLQPLPQEFLHLGKNTEMYEVSRRGRK